MKETIQNDSQAKENETNKNDTTIMEGEIAMKETIKRIINTLENVEVSGRQNMWNMLACINTLNGVEQTGETANIKIVADVLNHIPVAGKQNISFLCGCIDELNKLVDTQTEPEPDDMTGDEESHDGNDE